MPDMIDLIEKSRDISQSSLKLYKGQIRKLFGNLDPEEIRKKLKNVDDILKKIDEITQNDNTRKSYINIAVVCAKVLGAPNKTIDELDKALTQVASVVYDRQKKQGISERNKGRILSKQKIMDVLEKTRKIADLSFKNYQKDKDDIDPSDLEDYQDYVVVALYSLFPPRRNKDFVNMKVVAKLPKDLEPETNYLVGSNKRREFVFNSYKTRKTYGVQRFDVPANLNKIFNNWLKMNDTGVLLIDVIDMRPLGANELTKTLQRIFKKYAGVKISTTLLRKAYLTNKYGDEKAITEKEKDARMMGHSREEAAKSYIKPKAFELMDDDEQPQNELNQD